MQYFGADGLGSVRQIFDASAIVVGSSRYDPYGNVISQSGVGTSPYGYAGEWTDATGLEYLRTRYYASWQGRFTSADTIAGNPYAPPSMTNRYTYVGDNPIMVVDPTGRQSEPPPYVCDWEARINGICEMLNNPNTDPRILYQFYKEVAGLGPAANRDFRYAAGLMRHFLGNSGTTYKMPKEFIDEVYMKDEAVLNELNRDLNRYLVSVVKSVAEGLADCPGQTSDLPEAKSNVEIRGVSSQALFYAWNAHRVDIHYSEGSVTRNELGWYEIGLGRKYHAYDRYDWHGIGEGNLLGDFDTPFGRVTVPDEWAARVARAGLGAEFDMYADWSTYTAMTVKNGMWESPTAVTEVRDR